MVAFDRAVVASDVPGRELGSSSLRTFDGSIPMNRMMDKLHSSSTKVL